MTTSKQRPDGLLHLTWFMPLVVAAALFTALELAPPYPLQPSLKQFAGEEDRQWVATRDCEPVQLARILSPVAKQRRASICAADAERHREENDERWQATRTAVATEQATILAWRQSNIAAIGSAILLLTLGAAAWAALAATSAAKAADETLNHQQRTAERELRPYIFLDTTKIERKAPRPNQIVARPQKRTTGRVIYRYSNSGKTPARNVQVAAKAIVVKRGETIDLSDAGELRLVGPLGPKDALGDDVQIDGLTHATDILALTEGGEYEVHLFGRIEYRDEFLAESDEGRWTTFHAYVGGDVGWDATMHTHKDGNGYR